MSIITLSSGVKFNCSRSSTILDAALDNGVLMPYSCKTGRCSACKCKVMRGQTSLLFNETGLSAAEQAEGWILSCARAADTDVELQVEDQRGVVMPPCITVPCRIHALHTLSGDVMQIMLRLPPASDFKFIPGQYIQIIGPGGIRRSYSLANFSRNEKLLELHIREVYGGVMSSYWFGQAKVNDLLRLNGPLGTFFLRETKDVDLVFLATGTGIAPVKAMLESMDVVLVSDLQPRSVTVLWGGRTKEDLYLDFSSIRICHRYIPVLSRAGVDWDGARGHVQNVLLSLQPNLGNAAIYACGADIMIKEAKLSLLAAGLPENRFYSDAFVCSAN